MEAGDLKARSSCVDMEFSSLVSTNAGVDTKDLVAADVLTSCELAVAESRQGVLELTEDRWHRYRCW